MLPLPGWLPPGDRVWTRWVVFGVAGSGPRAGMRCQGVARGGCPAPVFVGLGTAPLPAGDARCPWIPVAMWCSGGCCCAARLDARSCRGLCGVSALDGAGASVVRVASAACCWCGVVTGASGAEVDGPENVEAVGPRGARARTFVALVAVVVGDRGRWVVMVALLREEEEELWCRAPPAIILATAALPYVPGRGGGTCGCWAHRANCWRLRGRGMPLHVR